MKAERIIDAVVVWAKMRPEIHAVALVGSYARGEAGEDSDFDFVLLVANPARFRADDLWPHEISLNASKGVPLKWQDEDYGMLWSRRIWLEPDGEVEIGFAPASWASVTPCDPGTERVISAGCRVLHDPEGILNRLCVQVQSNKLTTRRKTGSSSAGEPD